MKTTFVDGPSTFLVPFSGYVTVNTIKLMNDETLAMAVVEPLFTGFRVLYWHTDGDEEEAEIIVFGTWEEVEEFMVAHSVALRMS